MSRPRTLEVHAASLAMNDAAIFLGTTETKNRYREVNSPASAGALGERIRATFNLPHPPPVDVHRIAVLLVASDFTALAADAFGHVEVEPILLTGLERPQWDQRRLGVGPASRSGWSAGAGKVIVRIVGACSFEQG
jgi:hypothetical protein